MRAALPHLPRMEALLSRWRRAARVDENQNEIVKSLRAIPGVTVATGHDDILVGYMGRTFWFEVKTAIALRSEASTARAIKPSQSKLKREWKGHYQIVSRIDEILRVLLETEMDA